jgi:D-alanyl-D-alanine dipeptidase
MTQNRPNGRRGRRRPGNSVEGMVLLLSDPRVGLVPVHDSGDPVIPFPAVIGHSILGRASGIVHVRRGLAARLVEAAMRLPATVSLKVVEGHRSPDSQAAIIARYEGELRAAYPALDRREIAHLSSRFVAPLGVAPHVAGAAVDLTLVDGDGGELDMGTPIDATPEQSDGACYFAAENIAADARANRALLADALTAAGLVNYPTEWWHWSYGDRYWAVMTGAPHALYGPVDRLAEHGVAA